MSPKFESILKHFNRTDFRPYKLAAVCWRIWRFSRLPSPEYRERLERRNLLSLDGKLTACGITFAKRHEARFRAMQPPEPKRTGKTLTDEQKRKMQAGKEKRHD